MPINIARNQIKKVTLGLDMAIKKNITKKCDMSLQVGFREERNEWLAFIQFALLPCMHQLVMKWWD